jgi:tetratricopeptide (TPR) repeat protein
MARNFRRRRVFSFRIVKTRIALLAGLCVAAAFPLLLRASSAGDSPPAAAATGSPMVPPDLMSDARSAKDAFEHSQYLDAQHIYEKMLTRAPGNVYILSNLGVVYFRNQKWKLAEESLKKAITVAPGDAFSYCSLGIVYYQEKRYDAAIDALNRAIDIDPNDRDACFNLAVIYAIQQPPAVNMVRKYYARAIVLGAEPDAAIEQILKNASMTIAL